MPTWLKVLIGLVVFAVVVVILFTSVFPWVESRLLTDPVLRGAAAG